MLSLNLLYFQYISYSLEHYVNHNNSKYAMKMDIEPFLLTIYTTLERDT